MKKGAEEFWQRIDLCQIHVDCSNYSAEACGYDRGKSCIDYKSEMGH